MRTSFPVLPLILITLVFHGLVSPNFAGASSDDCEDSDTALHFSRPSPSDCSSDLPFLEPSNDSSSNLRLLLEQYVLPTKGESKKEDERGLEAEVELLKAAGISISEPLPESIPDEVAPDTELGTCVSNTRNSAAEFIRQIRVSGLSSEEKSLLVSSRLGLLKDCGKPGDYASWIQGRIPQIESLNQKSDFRVWTDYLKGAFELYHGSPELAFQSFHALSRIDHPWLREASEYLSGRAKLVASQSKWDGYGESPQGIDKDGVNSAEELLGKYLSDYPQGSYVRSARGLLRRAKRLKGETEKFRSALVEDFERTLKEGSAEDVTAMQREMENHLYAWSAEIPFQSPLLASEIIVMRNRDSRATVEEMAPEGSQEVVSWLEKLESGKDKYLAFPGLLEFLKAEVQFSLGKYDEVLKGSPEASIRRSMLGQSHLALLAVCAEKLGRLDEAKAIWTEVLENAKTADRRIRIALLRNRLRAKAFLEIAEAKPGEYPDIQRVFREVFTEATLKEILKDEKSPDATRQMAANALLYQYLLTDRFQDFLALHDSQGDPVKSEFTSISPTVRLLVTNTKDPRALLDLGHYQENFYDDPKHVGVSFRPSGIIDKSTGEIRDRSSILPEFYGKPGFKGAADTLQGLRPLHYYLRAREATVGKKVSDPDIKAEVLYRLIWCFRWTSCYDLPPASDIPKKQRAAWFSELKKQYPTSSWAEETKYYY